MKTRIPVPIIRSDQYEAFRGAMGANLPGTFDEFADLTKKKINEALRRGEIAVKVEVEFNEFMRFCSDRGAKPDNKALLDVAIEKMARQKH